MKRFLTAAMFLALLAPGACASPTATPTPTSTPTELEGGVVATFDVLGDTYSVFVTNEDTIDELFRWDAGQRESGIPNGALLRGPGAANHNKPWSWHLDPQDINIADLAAEVCDGTPSMVEADLDYWVGTVGRYCPWDAKLVDLEDYR